MGDVHIAVAHCNHAQVFFAVHLTGRGEFGYRADRSRLGHLTAGIRVNFRIEHQNIDIASGSDRVIQPAEADIVCPAVAADNPVRTLEKMIGKRKKFLRGRLL